MPYKDPAMKRLAKRRQRLAAKRARATEEPKPHHTTVTHRETRSALQVLKDIDMGAWREQQIQQAYARWKAERK